MRDIDLLDDFETVLGTFPRGIVGVVVPTEYKMSLRIKYLEKLSGKKISYSVVSNGKPDPRAGYVCCFGEEAVESLLGRKLRVMDTRRGWTISGGRFVWWTHSFEEAHGNSFMRDELKSDFLWGCALLHSSVVSRRNTVFASVVESESDAKIVLRRAAASKVIAYDTETAGAVFSDYFKIVTLAVACGQNVYVFDRHAIETPKIRDLIVKFFEANKEKLVGHNIKYDNLAVRDYFGVRIGGGLADTMLMRQLLASHCPASLDVCSELVGLGGFKSVFAQELKKNCALITKLRTKLRTQAEIERDQMLGEEKKGRRKNGITAEEMELIQSSEVLRYAVIADSEAPVKRYAFSLCDKDLLAKYCAQDTWATLLLYEILQKELSRDAGLLYVWDTLVSRANACFEDIECTGMRVDTEEIVRIAEDLEAQLGPMEEYFSEQLGLGNPKSPTQLAKLLFEDLDLPKVLKSRITGKPSAGTPALTLMLDRCGGKEQQILRKLIEYNRLRKLRDVYGIKMLSHVRADGRIHPTFNIGGTRTGRVSCSQPNLLNIPRSDTKEGKLIKNYFRARPGHVLVQGDLSQIELRIAAMLAKDEVMRGLFMSGEDFHLMNARTIAPTFGIRPELVNKDHKLRTQAKKFSFGLLYGMGDSTLAKDLKITVAQARKLREVIMENWSSYAKWSAKSLAYSKKTGYSHTYFCGRIARRRRLYALGTLSFDDCAPAVRAQFRQETNAAAGNTPVQGSASDYCLDAVIAANDWCRDSGIGAAVILTVYDSIVIEAPESTLDEVAHELRRIMTGGWSDGYPIAADIQFGTSWGSLRDYDFDDEKDK